MAQDLDLEQLAKTIENLKVLKEITEYNYTTGKSLDKRLRESALASQSSILYRESSMLANLLGIPEQAYQKEFCDYKNNCYT